MFNHVVFYTVTYISSVYLPIKNAMFTNVADH